MTAGEKKPGRYRGSEFVQIEVAIYPPEGVLSPLSSAKINHIIRIPDPDAGRNAGQNESIALVGFTYNHSINTAASSCVLSVKARGAEGTHLLNIIQPNYWIDVTVRRHKKRFHVFRGRISGCSIRTRGGAIGGAATGNILQLNCLGFGHILEQTQVYYDIVNEGTDLPLAYPKILISIQNDQSVRGTAKAVLEGFLGAGESGTGRSMWELPTNMPIAPGNTQPGRDDEIIKLLAPFYFKDVLQFFPDREPRAIENYPERVNSQALSWLTPARGGESLWAILQRWNDGPLVDMYCDLVGSDGKYLAEGQECGPGDTRMSFIIRDKPFPTTTRKRVDIGSLFTDSNGDSLTIDTQEYWFNEKTKENPGGYLPVFNIDWSDVADRTVARSDMARRNAFFLAPVLTQGLTPVLLSLQAPLWDPKDIQQNGFRPVFYSSPYLVDLTKIKVLGEGKDIATQINAYRRRIRDFMCLGHHYLSGVVGLAHGRPDIRVGGKLKIAGEAQQVINYPGMQPVPHFRGAGAADQLGGVFEEIYHIDGVTHSWSPVQGMRTQLTITRGIRGNDNVRTRLLSEKLKGFVLANKGGTYGQ